MENCKINEKLHIKDTVKSYDEEDTIKYWVQNNLFGHNMFEYVINIRSDIWVGRNGKEMFRIVFFFSGILWTHRI